MENFFVVALIIAGAVYKIYKNYQEEVDKAKKRPSANRRRPQQATVKQRREITPQHTQEFPPFENIKEMAKERLERDYEKSDLAQNENIPSETRRIREERRRRKAKELQNQLGKLEIENIEESNSFDLRQAVINAAVLERPYKDED